MKLLNLRATDGTRKHPNTIHAEVYGGGEPRISMTGARGAETIAILTNDERCFLIRSLLTNDEKIEIALAFRNRGTSQAKTTLCESPEASSI